MGTGIWEDKATLRVCKENETIIRLVTVCQLVVDFTLKCAGSGHVSDNIFVQVRRTIRPWVHVSGVGGEALLLGGG